MSKFVVCVIRDSASDGYGVPVFFHTPAIAIRTFKNEVNRAAEDNPLYRYPEDHVLWKLGSYDADSAMFELHAPEQLCRAKDVKEDSGVARSPGLTAVN